MTHQIQIQIGDWSGDGHGKCEHITFTSNMAVNEVREAYFNAESQFKTMGLGHLMPCNQCSDYGCGTISHKDHEEAMSMGFNPGEFMVDDSEICPDPEYFARYVAWFCERGNVDLKLKVAKEKDQISTLSFYGYDTKGRHIDFLGYGLFE